MSDIHKSDIHPQIRREEMALEAVCLTAAATLSHAVDGMTDTFFRYRDQELRTIGMASGVDCPHCTPGVDQGAECVAPGSGAGVSRTYSRACKEVLYGDQATEFFFLVESQPFHWVVIIEF